MIEIDKDKAVFLRQNLKDVCIRKTMGKHGSRRGTYYADESSAVIRLLSEYDNEQKISEEYPVSK